MNTFFAPATGAGAIDGLAALSACLSVGEFIFRKYISWRNALPIPNGARLPRGDF